jgi:hypothetical protein
MSEHGRFPSPEESKRINEQILERNLNVGRQKAVSYLPIRTIENVLGLRLHKYVSMIEDLGHKAMVLGPEECIISSGAVYAYSCEDLDEILQDNKAILLEHGWPTTSINFIRKMAVEWVDRENAIFPVIRKAFGER